MAGRLVGLLFARDPLAALDELARDPRDVVPFRVGPQRVFLVKAPTLIERVLDSGDSRISIGPMKGTARWFGGALISIEGPAHDQRWRKVSRSLRDAGLLHASRSVAFTGEVRDRWQAGRPVDIDREMLDLALRIIWELVFGTDVEEEAPDARRLFGIGGDMVPRLAQPLAGLQLALPLPTSRSFLAARRAVYELVDRKLREDGGGLQEQFADWQGQSTPQALRDAAMSLLPAHSMMGPAFAWACVLVSQNPNVGEKLHAEAESQLAGRTPTSEDLAVLPYATAAFRESLRALPAVWGIVRQAAEALDLDGARIPRGSLLIASPWVTHRDAALWAEPSRFDPERWDKRDGAYDGSYFPFGLGGRSCVADELVMRLGPLLLATIAQRWRLRPANPRMPALRAGVAVRPRGALELVPESW